MDTSQSNNELALVTGEVLGWREVTWDMKKKRPLISKEQQESTGKGLWVARAKTYSILLWNGRFILGAANNRIDRKRLKECVATMANPETRVRFLSLVSATVPKGSIYV